MLRIPVCAVVLLAVLALSCSKGDGRSSPTEPAPVTQATTLPGKWTGTMTVNRSDQSRVTCSLEVSLEDLGDPEVFLGTWSLQCPDRPRGGQQAVALTLPLGLVSLSGFASTAALDGCSWGAVLPRQGKKLSGDWQKPSNACLTSTIQGGTLELTKAE
jgi:hypothetical protein